jgi:membrane fusion protein (multidrug efflux system)
VRVKVEPLLQVYQGSIYLIDPRIDFESRNVVIRAKVANPEEVLKPGMFCTVEVVVEKKENGLMVPEQAVVSRGERHFLYLEEEGIAVMREVSLGIFLEGRVEIAEGLSPGDQVIIAGIQKLSPGVKVQELKAKSSRPE